MTPSGHPALESILAELAQAWNAGDGVRFAAVFAPGGVQVNIFGTELRGRREIAERHDRIFSTVFRGSTNTLRVIDAQPVAADVLLARVASVVDVPQGPLAGELRTVASLVLRKADGRWEILSFHNTRVVPEHDPGAR